MLSQESVHMMVKERGNGANVIVLDAEGRILVEQQNYGEHRWMLPGGAIERGESPSHAAQEETEEETGIRIDAENLKLVAYFVQRPNGVVFLFETNRFSGALITESNEEVLEARFMSVQEIFQNWDGFGLGYKRMILRYLRCKAGIDQLPFEGRLSDPVEFPRGGEYTDIVLRA